jgi:hypothetical protein
MLMPRPYRLRLSVRNGSKKDVCPESGPSAFGSFEQVAERLGLAQSGRPCPTSAPGRKRTLAVNGWNGWKADVQSVPRSTGKAQRVRWL